MKGLYVIGTMAILVGVLMPIPAKADLTECIYGHVETEYGADIPDLELEIENIDQSESIFVMTDDYGDYIADLNDFTNWEVGDWIWIHPGDLQGFYVCAPKFFLSATAAPAYAYNFDLVGTDLLEANYQKVDLGIMHLTNNKIDTSGTSWKLSTSQQVPYTASYDGVSIVLSDCYWDDGTNDVSQGASMTVHFIFTLFYKHTSESEWSYDAQHSTYTGSYTVQWHQNPPEAGNPPNLFLNVDETEALTYHWDFRSYMYCSDNGGSWEKNAYLSDIDFVLS